MNNDEDGDWDLFAKKSGGARWTDPSTSWEAAESIDVPDMELITLWATGTRGSLGANWLEQEAIIEQKSREIGRLIMQRQTISPRNCKLREKGFLEERYDENKNKIKRPGKTKRNQNVQFITPAGEAILRLRAAVIERLLRKA